MTRRVDLDWSRLLGFDQTTPNANLGNVPCSAKIGSKQLIHRGDEVDLVAIARLTKVGIKGRRQN
jgi:hypothetical protein